MSNIFADLVAKLTRRQKKGKPVPVPVKPEPPLKAVTHNRADGVVSGNVFWDKDAGVHRGKTAAQKEADRRRREDYDRDRRDYDEGNDFGLFVAGSTFDESFFYQNAPESPSTGSDYSGGYDGYTQSVPEPYVAPSTSYSAPEPSYTAPSYTDYGSSSSSSSYSDSGSSSSSSSYSDSGSSGGYSGE